MIWPVLGCSEEAALVTSEWLTKLLSILFPQPPKDYVAFCPLSAEASPLKAGGVCW